MAVSVYLAPLTQKGPREGVLKEYREGVGLEKGVGPRPPRDTQPFGCSFIGGEGGGVEPLVSEHYLLSPPFPFRGRKVGFSSGKTREQKLLLINFIPSIPGMLTEGHACERDV